MFRSKLFDHFQGAVFRVECWYYFSACLRRQVVYLVCGCMLSMCVRALMYLSVGSLVVNNYHCVTTAYSLQYSNMLYRFVA